MVLIVLLIFFNFYLSSSSKGQKKSEKFEFDSTYVVFENRWSLRLHTTFKFQNIILRNKENGNATKYVPRNPLGVGIGFASRQIVLDLGINLRADKESPQSQFDFQTSLLVKKEALDLFIQRYKGFEGKFANKNETIRDDITTLNLGVNYAHIFRANKMSMASVLHGVGTQKKSVGSFLAGFYFGYYQLQSDSSIVPPSEKMNFNAFANIRKNNFYNFGIILGYAHIFILPNNYYVFLSIFPGVGATSGSIEAEEKYSPNNIPSGKVNARAAIGKFTKKNYVILSLSTDNFLINIENNNRYRYGLGKIKLVIGFRMKSKPHISKDFLP